MKRNLILSGIAAIILLIAGCKNKSNDFPNKLTPTPILTATAVPTATQIPEPTKPIAASVFKEIPPNSVFHVNWNTADGELMAGTASCVTTDFSEQPILITAFHYFGSDDANEFAGSDLVDFVNGGEIFDILTYYGYF